jgi:ferredoxin
MVKITANGSGQSATYDADETQSIGMQAVEEGIMIPIACGAGACSTCKCKVTKGLEHINREGIGSIHMSIEDDEILSCVATVKEDAPENAEIEFVADN